MLSDRASELLVELRRSFRRWDCQLDDDRLELRYGRSTGFQPRRRPPDWADLLDTLESAFAKQGITRGRLLPLHGLGDAELTFSAVQALDPYLKRGESYTYSAGYLPQPVVRFTGERDERGALRPGFLTSFVNVSCVRPVASAAEHVELIDAWVSVLSALGFHAGQLRVAGRLEVWQRGPVSGITLHIHHEERPLGDAVLLWRTDDPMVLATDIGSGLERLRWLLSGRPWAEVVHGELARSAEAGQLDAIRTATLLIGSRIYPAARGPGSAVRRVLSGQQRGPSELGFSRAVRLNHRFWDRVSPLPVCWPEICRHVDDEMLLPIFRLRTLSEQTSSAARHL
jgi:hypothetical protein